MLGPRVLTAAAVVVLLTGCWSAPRCAPPFQGSTAPPATGGEVNYRAYREQVEAEQRSKIDRENAERDAWANARPGAFVLISDETTTPSDVREARHRGALAEAAKIERERAEWIKENAAFRVERERQDAEIRARLQAEETASAVAAREQEETARKAAELIAEQQVAKAEADAKAEAERQREQEKIDAAAKLKQAEAIREDNERFLLAAARCGLWSSAIESGDIVSVKDLVRRGHEVTMEDVKLAQKHRNLEVADYLMRLHPQ